MIGKTKRESLHDSLECGGGREDGKKIEGEIFRWNDKQAQVKKAGMRDLL